MRVTGGGVLIYLMGSISGNFSAVAVVVRTGSITVNVHNHFCGKKYFFLQGVGTVLVGFRPAGACKHYFQRAQ